MPVPEFLTDSVVASQLAVLAGVHWCAKLSVNERTANLALTPPLLAQEDKDKAEAAKRKAAEERAAAALIPWYRRFFSRKTAVASLPLLAIVASQGFFVFVLPRITNELVYQLFWMCMCSVVISGLTSSMLFVFFSGPLSLALKRHSTNVRSISQHQDTATPDAEPFFFVKRNRNIVAFVLAWCIIGYTAYAERNYVLPLFAGVVVIAVFTSISFFTVSARWMTFVSAGVTAFMAVFIPLIIALVPKSKPDDAPSSKQFMPTMPQWLLSLMMVSGGGILAFPVMFLVAMTLRYDHFGPSSSPALGPDKAAPGEAVPIPFNVPITRPTPLYRTAMATMAICYLASDIVVYHLVDNGTIKFIDGPGRAALTPQKLRNERSDSIKIASAATVNLFVPLAVALVAWCRGDLKSWWNYYEEWVPKENPEAAEQADVDDAEKALLDSEDASVEEKKALST